MRSRDDGQLEIEQRGDFPEPFDLVADPQRDVVRRALSAPVVEERRRIPEKRIREFVFPILNVGPATDSPSAARSLSRPSAVCVTPRMVTGPRRTFISIERPGARLAVVEPERAGDRSSVGDREVARAVVAHQDELLVEVEAVELGVGASGAEPVEQQHRDVGLEVAFARGRARPAR